MNRDEQRRADRRHVFHLDDQVPTYACLVRPNDTPEMVAAIFAGHDGLGLVPTGKREVIEYCPQRGRGHEHDVEECESLWTRLVWTASAPAREQAR